MQLGIGRLARAQLGKVVWGLQRERGVADGRAWGMIIRGTGNVNLMMGPTVDAKFSATVLAGVVLGGEALELGAVSWGLGLGAGETHPLVVGHGDWEEGRGRERTWNDGGARG